jgi:hypothetical protein
VKLVEPKYVSVGSVRKLVYAAAVAASAFFPLTPFKLVGIIILSFP